MNAVAKNDEDRTRAAIVSFIFHLVFFALLWFYKISSSEITPVTPEIVIDFNGGGGDTAAKGEPDRGMNDAPAPKGDQLEDPTSKAAVPVPVPTPPTPAKADPKPAKSEPTKTDLPKNTPTTEDPEVAAIKKQREETRKKQEAEEETRKTKQREEQATADAKRRADQAAADKAAAEKAAYDKRKGQFGGALGGNKPGGGAGGGGKPGNGGVTDGTGDNPFGKSAGSGGGDGGGSGGGSGEGIGGGLRGRKVTSRPTADCPVKEKGVVVVKVTVDSQGNVTDASPTLSGSTLSDEQSKSCAVKTAKKFKFATSDASSQTGTIAVKFNFN
jgi:colicin import membrane protein